MTILFFIIVFLETASFLIFNKYTIFYQTSRGSEQNLTLYSVFDPTLGYTFNSEVKSTNKLHQIITSRKKNITYLNNGFIIMDYKSSHNALKIAILGGSATDSNLFNGNWPWFLHELLMKNDIPHVIYNGAISGYNSYQELYKLIRDVFEINRIEIVIVYDGINDILGNGDILNNDHPSIHPYQKYLFDKLSGNITFFRDPKFLPNLTYSVKLALKEIFKNKYVNLGVATRSVTKNYLKNIKYMKLISNENNARFMHFLQPVLLEKSMNNRTLQSTQNYDQVILFYEKVKPNLNKSFSEALQNIFQSQPTLFIDFSHLNDLGNKIIARVICQRLKIKLKHVTKISCF